MAEKKRGRPVKYTPEVIEDGLKGYQEYLEAHPERMPTMAGLARFTKIPRLTLHRKRESGECGEAFDDFYDYLLQRHEEHCFTKTANGASVFVLKQYGYSDKQEVAHSGGVDIQVKWGK